MTGQQQALLALVKAHPLPHQRGELDAAFGVLGLSPWRAWQIINRLIDDPAAWEADPIAVGWLSRRRVARGRRRPSPYPPG